MPSNRVVILCSLYGRLYWKFFHYIRVLFNYLVVCRCCNWVVHTLMSVDIFRKEESLFVASNSHWLWVRGDLLLKGMGGSGDEWSHVQRVLRGLGKINKNLFYLERRGSMISLSWISCGSSYSGRIGIYLEMLALWWEENRRTRRNTIGTRRELKPDELNPHLVPGRNRTRATLVGGKRSQKKLVSRAFP